MRMKYKEMSLKKPIKKTMIPNQMKMSNITIRGRRDISCSTSKLINKKTAITRLPRAVSVISLHDCQTKISTKNFYQYKKSLSLQDLSPASQKNVNLKSDVFLKDSEFFNLMNGFHFVYNIKGFIRSITPQRRLFSQMENEQITSPRETEIEPLNQDRMKNLAVKVYVAFLRNAMTKLLHKCTQQDNSISTMNAQIKNSKMQITTLKSLLRSDEQFIRDWIKELRKLRKKIELLTNERDDLRIENHNIESNYEELQEKFTQVKVELLNEKNLLEQARGEATAFENQLIKEREKIQTLRNELKKASEKKLMLEDALQSKNNDLNTFSATVRDMEIQICTQIDLLKLTEEKLVSNTEKLKLEEKQVKMLKAEVEVSKVSIISLNKDKSYLLNELEERNRNYGNLEKAYKEQTIQLIELQNSMKALEAQTLTSKLVRVAKKFIRVPLKVLETVSTQC